MRHKYFTINERNKLKVLLKENYRISKIAQVLNRHRATIYREIKRINGEYSSENAQADANAKAANKGRNSKITPELKNLIEDRLCKTWSPEQIAGRELKGRLSFKTIYNWLYSDFLEVSMNVLRRKGRRAKTKETRGKFNIGKSIGDRPEEVKKKRSFRTLGTGFCSFVKRGEQSLPCNICGIEDTVLYSSKDGRQGQGIFMLGGSGEDGNRFLFCRSILLMAERLQREQQRPSKRILPKEDRHIKDRYRRLDKNLNADKFKTKKMFKLCNTV